MKLIALQFIIPYCTFEQVYDLLKVNSFMRAAAQEHTFSLQEVPKIVAKNYLPWIVNIAVKYKNNQGAFLIMLDEAIKGNKIRIIDYLVPMITPETLGLEAGASWLTLYSKDYKKNLIFERPTILSQVLQRADIHGTLSDKSKKQIFNLTMQSRPAVAMLMQPFESVITFESDMLEQYETCSSVVFEQVVQVMATLGNSMNLTDRLKLRIKYWNKDYKTVQDETVNEDYESEEDPFPYVVFMDALHTGNEELASNLMLSEEHNYLVQHHDIHFFKRMQKEDLFLKFFNEHRDCYNAIHIQEFFRLNDDIHGGEYYDFCYNHPDYQPYIFDGDRGFFECKPYLEIDTVKKIMSHANFKEEDFAGFEFDGFIELMPLHQTSDEEFLDLLTFKLLNWTKVDDPLLASNARDKIFIILFEIDMKGNRVCSVIEQHPELRSNFIDCIYTVQPSAAQYVLDHAMMTPAQCLSIVSTMMKNLHMMYVNLETINIFYSHIKLHCPELLQQCDVSKVLTEDATNRSIISDVMNFVFPNKDLSRYTFEKPMLNSNNVFERIIEARTNTIKCSDASFGPCPSLKAVTQFMQQLESDHEVWLIIITYMVIDSYNEEGNRDLIVLQYLIDQFLARGANQEELLLMCVRCCTQKVNYASFQELAIKDHIKNTNIKRTEFLVSQPGFKPYMIFFNSIFTSSHRKYIVDLCDNMKTRKRLMRQLQDDYDDEKQAEKKQRC